MKRRLLMAICMAVFCVCSAIAQSETVRHTVDRGETLASIAKRYATTEAKILEFNPDAKHFIYVGMELIIPVEKKTVPTQEKVEERTQPQHNWQEQTTLKKEKKIKVSYGEEEKRWNFCTNIGYGIIPKPKKEKGTYGYNYAISFTAGANYLITKSLYAGARLGYSAACTSTTVISPEYEIMGTDITSHSIYLPIELGYKLNLGTRIIAFVPYLGIDIGCVVKCKSKSRQGSEHSEESRKVEDRMGVNGRVGLRLNLATFQIGGSYVFAFNDHYGDRNGFPEISIGFAF